MTIDIVHPKPEESFDEKVERISSLDLGPEVFAHWNLDPSTDLASYVRSFNDDIKSIRTKNGISEFHNELGELVMTYPSQETLNAVYEEITAYNQARFAWVSYTDANNDVTVFGTTFMSYLEKFAGNSEITLVSQPIQTP